VAITIDDTPPTQDDLTKTDGILLDNWRDFTEVADVLLHNLPPVRRTESRWFVYNGRVYEVVSEERLAARCRPILDRCYWEKTNPQTGDVTKVPVQPTKGYIAEALAALGALDGVWMTQEPDQNTDELLVANGRVQLATGELLPHSPSVWATKMTDLAYEPELNEETAEAAERWLAHLDALELGPEMLDYLQRALGCSITGRGTEKAFFFLYGKPHTGKSTLVFCAMDVLGKTTGDVPGYCAQTNAEAWIESRTPGGSGHTDALMPIAGARLVYVDETPENCRFNSGLLKNCTNGMGAQNKIRLSAKREKGFDAPTCFSLWFSSNHMPGTQDEGTLSRLKLIQHEKVIEAPDPAFFRKFMTPAMRKVILLWLVDGARRYIAEGLAKEPVAITLNRAEYQADHDLLGMFIKECCVFDRTLRTKAATIRQRYILWAKANEVKSVPSPTAWGKLLRERFAADPALGVERYQKDGMLAFSGVGLNDEYTDRPVW
jgi:putative DNA primase/helicase